MPEKLNFTEFMDLVLVRLYELDKAEGAQFYNVNEIAAELREPVPDQWVPDAAKALEDRGLVSGAFALDQTTNAVITGEGRLYVEGRQHATEVIEQYRQQPTNFVFVSGHGHHVAVDVQGDVSQISLSGDVQAQALQIVGAMREALERDDSLDAQARDEALEDVSALEGQIKRTRFNKNVVLGLIGSLSGIASVAQLAIKLGELVN